MLGVRRNEVELRLAGGGIMSVISSSDWEAIELTDLTGGNRQLNVSGKVEVAAGNQEPVLTEAMPQGINPRILILELTTRDEGDVGADVVTCKDAYFEKGIGLHQYDQVDIRGQAVVDVEEVLS
jgi:hypothetical protein